EQVNDRSLLLPSVQAALFLALFFAGVSIVKQTMDRASAMSVSEMLTAAAWSIATHLLLFLFAFAALTVVRIAARRFSVPAQAEFALTCGLAIIFGYVVFRRVVLPTITLSNRQADIFSLVVSAIIVAYFSGVRLRLHQSEAPAASGFEFAMRSLAPKTRSTIESISWLLVICLLGYTIPAAVARTDWDFLAQRTWMVVIWTITFSFFFIRQPQREKKGWKLPGVVLML